MRKLKFQFNNEVTPEAAQQIESALKQDAGVTNAKVNSETKKGVVIYDEDVTAEAEILKTVQETGHITPEVLAAEMETVAVMPTPHQSIYDRYTPTQLFWRGLGLPLGAAVIIGIIIFVGAQFVGIKSASGAHLRGDKNAPVKMVEYSDFECPFCKRHHPTLKQILQEYGDKVSLEYKHFPLGFHPNAQKAAEASECAAEQSKFWEFHDAVFEDRLTLGIPQYKQWAEQNGLNAAQFNNCLDSGEYAAKVQSEYQEGQTKGVQGTPATFINGQLVSGAQPYEAVKQAIEQALQSQ